MPADSMSGKGPVPGSETTAFSLCPHVTSLCSHRGTFLSCSARSTDPIIGAPPSGPPLTQMTSQRPGLQIPIALGIRVSTSECGGTQVFSPQRQHNTVIEPMALFSPLNHDDDMECHQPPPHRPCNLRAPPSMAASSPSRFPGGPRAYSKKCPRPRNLSPSVRSDLGWRCLFVPAGDQWPAQIIGF